MGSGCVSVGSTVCSDTRGPRFESSHGQNFNICLPTVNCIEKTKITKKRPGMAHFFIKRTSLEFMTVKLFQHSRQMSEDRFEQKRFHHMLGMQIRLRKFNEVSMIERRYDLSFNLNCPLNLKCIRTLQ